MLKICTAAILGILLAGCAPPAKIVSGRDVTNKQPAATTFVVGDYRLEEPVSAGNVAVVPISLIRPSEDQAVLDRTITLQEAKKLGLVEIIERPGSAQVSRLSVRNLSDRTLLLMAGELLLGGKQDRIIAKDALVPPQSTREVAVYCVEHGRWSDGGKRFTYSSSVVPTRVQKAAMYGEQQQVWDKVAEFNSGVDADQTRSTVGAGMNARKVRTTLTDRLPQLRKVLDRKDVVGLIFVLNGKIESMDLFGHPRLFAQTGENLLRGYLAESATLGQGNAIPLSMEACRDFLAQSLKSERELTAATENSAGVAVESPEVKGKEMRMRAGGKAVFAHGNYVPNSGPEGSPSQSNQVPNGNRR